MIGFQLQRFELWRTYGVMLRGEVVFEDGRVLKLFSNPSMAKASAVEEPAWADPDFDDSAWDEMNVPGCWDESGKFHLKPGTGWYRKRFIARANRLD